MRCRSPRGSRRWTPARRPAAFFAAMWPTFFIRVRPASRKAKPACMNITRIAGDEHPHGARRDVELSGSSSDLHLLQWLRPVRLCVTFSTGDVQTIPSPDSLPLRAASTIAATTASATSSSTTNVRTPSAGTGLEDPAAVLVRDAALAAVADRLDHRHPDVSGLVLDRVDHGLDALPDDDRLDLGHRTRLPSWTNEKTPGALPLRPRCLLPPPVLGGAKRAP